MRATLLLTFTGLLAVAACNAEGSVWDPPDDSDAETDTPDTDDTDDSDAPVVLPGLLQLDDASLFPESLAWDPFGQRFLSGSLDDGRVFGVAPDGGVTVLFTPPSDPDLRWSTRGVKVDTEGRIWSCSLLGGSPHVFVLDGDGTLVHDVDLTAVDNDASCNDLAFLPDRVLVTDERNPTVYSINPTSFTAELWLSDPLLDEGLVSGNGIVWADPWVIIGLYSAKAAIAVDPATRLTHEVTLLGDVPPLGGGNGWDGLLWDGTHLWVAGVGEVLRFTPDDPDWGSATGEGVPTTDGGWTSLTLALGQVYGLRSDPIAFVLGYDPELPFEIVRITAP